MCKHIICNTFLQNPEIHRSSAVLIMYYGNVILGLERWGSKNRKNKYGMCMGKMSQSDNFCWLKCAIRELREEFKIHMSVYEFSNFIMSVNFINGTPIFVMNGFCINYAYIREEVEYAYEKMPPSHLNEIITLRCFPVDLFKGEKVDYISPFTRNAVRQFMQLFSNNTFVEN